jgi:hypothetical protein
MASIIAGYHPRYPFMPVFTGYEDSAPCDGSTPLGKWAERLMRE